MPASSPNASPSQPSRPLGWWLRRVVLAGLGAGLAGVLGVVGLFLYHGRDLPNFDAIADYRPPQTSRVYDRNGALVAEYATERRTVVPFERIPKVLKDAVIAAEDGNFYSHRGLDYLGIARAVFKDLRHMRMAQGASTITQQVVKNLVLSPEQTVARKVKEAILARRLEQNLSKDEILWLYLTHINFGHGRYGVAEAARFYFSKPVEALTLGEAALLAGIPKSPKYLTPLLYPEKAKNRQIYVLRQMVETKAITAAQAEAEIARPLPLNPERFEPVGPYYVEEVRRLLVARYGEPAVYGGGLRIDVAMDRTLQAASDAALRSGLEDLQRRFGLRPPEVTVPRPLLEEVRGLVFARPERRFATVWDLAAVDAGRLASAQRVAEAVTKRPLAVGVTAVVPVAAVSDVEVRLDLGREEGTVPFDRLKWARPFAPAKYSAPPKRPSDAFAPGQLVRVRAVELAEPRGAREARAPAGGDAESLPIFEIVQVPAAQGALVAIEPETRQVVALSGGYDFEASPFNRATQARRQPGSAFKPFVYAAALASGKYTTASIVNDAPELIRDPWTGKEWRPQNFERDLFEGPMTLREALSKSKNTVSVRLIEAIGPSAVIDFARRAGIASPMPENLTLALGTAEVSPLELANAYATLAVLGKRADPVLLVRVTDPAGKVLEEHRAVAEETLPPAVAAITTSLMRSVVEFGTGTQALELRRPIAGKTGTASGNRDTWFAAFTADYVAAAWVGFDDHAPLGASETGGKAALPIWLEFMKAAHQDKPVRDFALPPGVEQVRIDPQSGLRSPDGAPGRLEVFAEGTAPAEFAVRPGEADPDHLFLEDGGRRR